MTGISRRRRKRATWRGVAAAATTTAVTALAAACGGRAVSGPRVEASAVRVVPAATAIVLETAGPPPSDTAVSFAAGALHVVVLRHGPPENVVFAEVSFPPRAFRVDSGRVVSVEIRPRPGVYGLEVATSQPLRQGASVTFKYARYFSAPARARTAFGSDVLYERALAVGQVQAGGSALALLPSSRPTADNLRAPLPASGIYLVAAAP
ncbi:MAG: hypothetical protein M3Q93_09350 [Gemmatimonadota bacterium]|nr:hypothetical protein [Gemmatimonadota bacterium]